MRNISKRTFIKIIASIVIALTEKGDSKEEINKILELGVEVAENGSETETMYE